MNLINIKKFSIVVVIAALLCVMSFTTVFAEDVVTDPVTEPVATEPVTQAPETEPVYTEPASEPETEPATEPVTEPVTQAPETEPETQAPETEPETQAETEPEVEPAYTEPNYNENNLPTLVDSTQVAEELPTAIGADEDGGVSLVGGIVCWIAVLVSACVIIAFLLSTKGKGMRGYSRGKKYQ